MARIAQAVVLFPDKIQVAGIGESVGASIRGDNHNRVGGSLEESELTTFHRSWKPYLSLISQLNTLFLSSNTHPLYLQPQLSSEQTTLILL